MGLLSDDPDSAQQIRDELFAWFIVARRARGMGGWTVRSRSNHDLPRKLLIMGDSKIEQEKGQSWHGMLVVLGGFRLFELSCYRWV